MERRMEDKFADTYKKLEQIGMYSEDERSETILLLAGTGINFWIYYPILARFTIEELNQFAAIYTISGASAVTWVYSLAHYDRLFKIEQMKQFDRELRRHMNGSSLTRRMLRMVKGYPVYSNRNMRRLFAEYVHPTVEEQTFAEFGIQNLHVVAHDVDQNSYQLFSKAMTPDENVINIMSSVVMPKKFLNRAFARPLDGYESVSDFDFAPREIKKQFYEDLRKRHPGKRIVILNLVKDEQRGHTELVKVPLKEPLRKAQILDLARVFLNMPNPAIGEEFRRVHDQAHDREV
jgi:hypothetical protein